MTPLLKMVILKICPFIFIVGLNKLGLLLIILLTLEHPKAQSPPHYLVSSTLILSVISFTLTALNSLYLLVTPKFGSTAWTTLPTSSLGYQIHFPNLTCPELNY